MLGEADLCEADDIRKNELDHGALVLSTKMVKHAISQWTPRVNQYGFTALVFVCFLLGSLIGLLSLKVQNASRPISNSDACINRGNEDPLLEKFDSPRETYRDDQYEEPKLLTNRGSDTKLNRPAQRVLRSRGTL